jgi:glycine/D-amino acid oxidase-like deaminating enzyme
MIHSRVRGISSFSHAKIVMYEFELVVIGAGIVGAVAAYLARQQRTPWRILLVDRSLVGTGATQYSVGLDIPYGRNSSQKHYSRVSTTIYRDLKTIIPELPIYELPFFGVVDREKANGTCARFTKDGIRKATERERAQLHESYQDLTIYENQILLSGCTASYGFPQQIVRALVTRLREARLTECWEGVEIHTVQTRGEGFSLATSDGRSISARRVLVATGPWLLVGPGNEVARDSGVRIKKVAALHVNRCPTAKDPVVVFFDEDAFLLPVIQRQEWIFSFTSDEWDCTPESSLLTIGKRDRDLALAILNRYCPSFLADCHGGRVFCDAYSRDLVPLVTRIQGRADFVIAGACSGSGYRLAPGIALDALSQLY